MRFSSKKYVSLLVLVAIMLQVMIPMVSFAKSENSIEAHRLPILGSFPIGGSSQVRPDVSIKIWLDANDKNFNRFKQQFKKGSFKVVLNGESCESTYDETNKVITVKNKMLERYTDYSVRLSLKADMTNDENNSNNSSYTFSFKTGSAIGEAVNLTADFIKVPVRVTDEGQISVKVTDDYGLPSTNATVRLSSDTEKIVAKPLHLGVESNGEGIISFTHHEKGKVLLNVIAWDNIYGSTLPTQKISKEITLIAGLPNHINIVAETPIVVGKTAKISGTVYDIYNNKVENDIVVSAEVSQGIATPEEQNTNDGEFVFHFDAPTVVSEVYFKAKSNDIEAIANIQLVADQPANLVFDSVEYEFEQDESNDIVLTVTDIYGNPVTNTKCIISAPGLLEIPDEVTTDSNGKAVITISALEDISEESIVLTAETENGIKGSTTLLFKINNNPPDAPVVLASKENGNIILRWEPISNASYYSVRRKSTGESYKFLREYLTESFFADGDLISGNTYSYCVTASNDYGESVASSEVVIDYTKPMNDLGTLSADKYSVYTNQSSTIIFKVAPEGRLANNASINLGLTDESGNVLSTVVQLRDDGNISNGDDIKTDGVYSGKITINETAEKVLRYKAFVSTSINDSIVSLSSENTIEINVIAQLSTEQISLSQTISNQAITVFKSTLASEGEDSAAQKTLDYLRTASGVVQSGYSTDSKTVWYILSSGIKCVIPVTQPDTNGSMSSITMNFDNDGTKTYYPLYSNISSALGQSGYSAQLIEDGNVTLSRFKSLSLYKAIVINSHGGLFQDIPYICSGEAATSDKIKLYEQDIKTGKLIIVTTPYGSYFGVMPDYIKAYNTSLNDSIIFLSSCRGLQNSKLWDVFKALGAKTMFGFDGDVYKDYAAETARVLFYNMLNDGLTAGQAYDWTIKELAASDIAWKLKNNITPPQKTPAYFKMYGEKEISLKFEQYIANGDFENGFTDWVKSGDARVISQLGPLVPVSGNNMAIISTGLGSVSDSNSYIEQSFYVPKGSKVLSFDYNVVSEEPTEWIGSSYNDAFRTSIQLKSGSKEIAYESINTSKWVYVSGIDFYGGDSTAYMTGWKHVDFDVSQYQGEYVTLKFHVWDVGDSAYDTAVLIDNVNMDGNGSGSLINQYEGPYLTWPVMSSEVTLRFGEVDEIFNKKHIGVDVQCVYGDAIFAAYDGKVIYSGFDEGYGNVVIINSKFNNSFIQTKYAHLSKCNVNVGQIVSQGEIIGRSGNSGEVSGESVLHFEVLFSTNNSECLIDGSNTINVDPLIYTNLGSSSNLDYLSKPFSIGKVAGDEFSTMGWFWESADERYMKNLDLKEGEAYLRKLVEYFTKDSSAISWDSKAEVATVNLNGKTKYYSTKSKYNNARIANKRLVVKIEDFISFFYPNKNLFPKFSGNNLSIEMKYEYNLEVALVQAQLKQLEYKGFKDTDLNINGYFDVNTEKAVNDFKFNNGLSDTGEYFGKVGATTWDLLFSESAKKCETKQEYEAYIFYALADSKNKGFEDRAKSDAKKWELLTGKPANCVPITSENEFETNWNSMGGSNKRIRYVGLYFHSNAHNQFINTDNLEYITAHDNGNCRGGNSLVENKDNPMGIPIASLDSKNVDKLYLYSCNSGHLSHTDDSLAIKYTMNHNISRVFGWDGSMKWSSDGNFVRLSYDTSIFESHLKPGEDREAEGLISYYKKGNGSGDLDYKPVNADPNKTERQLFRKFKCWAVDY